MKSYKNNLVIFTFTVAIIYFSNLLQAQENAGHVYTLPKGTSQMLISPSKIKPGAIFQGLTIGQGNKPTKWDTLPGSFSAGIEEEPFLCKVTATKTTTFEDNLEWKNQIGWSEVAEAFSKMQDVAILTEHNKLPGIPSSLKLKPGKIDYRPIIVVGGRTITIGVISKFYWNNNKSKIVALIPANDSGFVSSTNFIMSPSPDYKMYGNLYPNRIAGVLIIE